MLEIYGCCSLAGLLATLVALPAARSLHIDRSMATGQHDAGHDDHVAGEDHRERNELSQTGIDPVPLAGEERRESGIAGARDVLQADGEEEVKADSEDQRDNDQPRRDDTSSSTEQSVCSSEETRPR